MIVQQVEPVANRSNPRRPTSCAGENSQKPADALSPTRLLLPPIDVQGGTCLCFLQARALPAFRAFSELVDCDLALQQKFACDPLSRWRIWLFEIQTDPTIASATPPIEKSYRIMAVMSEPPTSDVG